MLNHFFRSLLPAASLLLGTTGVHAQEPAAKPKLPSGGKPDKNNDAPLLAEMREGAKRYAEAFNQQDFKSLGDQWTSRAELNEAGRTIIGREAIVQFVRATFVRAPKALMEAQVDEIRVLGAGTVRVNGSIRVRENPEARWITSRFESLRVKEDGVWRIASSTVVGVPDASLEDLGWLVGKWKAEGTEGEDKGLVVEGGIQKMLDGKLLAVHLRRQPKEGPAVESIQILHADRRAGQIRTWIFESTGGRAEGLIESDGHTLNSVLVGRPADPVVGNQTASVQVLTPVSQDEFIWQPIERELDGVRLPDQKPLRFRRQK